MQQLEDRFTDGLSPQWHVVQTGQGRVVTEAGQLHLTDDATARGQYSNAQISDYDYQTFQFRWQPPVRLTVTAQASGPGTALHGTAGFGFWNHPLSPEMARSLPRLPRAVWFFFCSSPGDLKLAYGVPGAGWKAAALDAAQPRALALIPLALPVMLLTRIPRLYQSIWPPIQRVLRISEHLLDSALLAEKHTYAIDWRTDGITFYVDDQVVMTTPNAPSGHAGFIAWIDNQYAVVTPQGHFRWGLLPLDSPQTLTLSHIRIEQG